METTTIHTYKALKFFKGLNLEGKEVDFAPDDIIEGVENWPTFEALKRINWITSVSVLSKPTTKPVVKAEVVAAKIEPVKEIAVVEEKKTEVKVETVLVKEQDTKEVDLESTEVSCEQCSKIFNSKRALSVHIKRAH
jgi:hypothetical protein